MSHNRRGNAFNKNINSSSVGQRRPIVTNNYVSNLPPQNMGPQQMQNQGYVTQQHAQRQQNSTPQRQSPQQQQLAKQQQMLVQKKQQLAQQQRQQQQKQQLVQQKQIQVQKQQQEVEKQKEQELQKQRELELQKQKELNLQKQKELEIQKQREQELQKQKQKELELQKQKELELQKQRELEQQRQKELEEQKQRELEQQQKQRESEMQKQLELQRQKLEAQKQMEAELKQKMFAPQTQSPIKTDQKPVMPPIQQESATPWSIGDGGEQASMDETMENGVEGKPFRKNWKPRRKLSKYEIQRRRNLKLSKLLQPKNAMAILNEIIKNITYNVDNSPTVDGYLFKATVVIEDITHEGLGVSKVAAKNNAAERALQFMVKNKKLIHLHNSPPKEGEEPMDTSSDKDAIDMPLAWQQFASFAVYKLLDAWGEDPSVIREDVRPLKKPARKMPANANLMNPLMLLNQMMPHLEYEELPRTSNGYFFTFNYRCITDGQTFTGSGTSKKVAKRSLAFEICRNILSIEYPPEIYTPPTPAVKSQ